MALNLDMDALRSFVTGIELGSFARAADVVGRSQSAVSSQLRKLENQVGEPLVKKAGRGLALTEAGHQLMNYGRRILDLNDEAVAASRTSRSIGSIKLGLAVDFAGCWLANLLRQFRQNNANVQIEVRSARSGTLRSAFNERKLDLILAWGDETAAPGGERLADVPMRWIAHEEWIPAIGEPLAFVAFDTTEHPCVFREVGVRALENAGISNRVVFNSSDLAGLWSALRAGVGVTARTAIGIPEGVRFLDEDTARLPRLPTVPLSLYQSKHLAEPTAGLAEMIRLNIRNM